MVVEPASRFLSHLPDKKGRGVSPAFGYGLLTLPAEPQEKELEVKLQCKLDLPRSLCTCDPAHVWAHPSIWSIEGGCVSEVNKLRTELKPVPFSQEEVLLEPQVYVSQTWPIQRTVPASAKLPGCGGRKRRRIKVLEASQRGIGAE